MGWVGDVWSMEQVEEAKEHHTLVYITRMCQNKPELQKICETETASVFLPVLLIQHASWNVALFRDTEIAANFLILGFSGKLKTELQ